MQLWGACKTVYDCLKSGADWERSAIAGTVAFFAGLGFEGTGEKYVDLMVDLTFSLGSSLSSAGITEGVQRYEGNDPSRWALPSINLGGGCGGKPMQSTVPQLVNINSY